MRSLLLLLMLMSGCTSHSFEPQGEISKTDARTLRYQGDIYLSDVQKLLTETAGDRSIQHLVITSDGGDAVAAMLLGEWVHSRGMLVTVIDHCTGSCANYIFTAARQTYLAPGANVGWGAGAWQQQWHKPWYTFLTPGFENNRCLSVSEWRQREADFFKQIGVRQEITLIGELPNLSEQRKGKEWWSYQAQDLVQLGVSQPQGAAIASTANTEVLQFANGELQAILQHKRITPKDTVSLPTH